MANRIEEIRRASTFANFEPHNRSQQIALDTFQQLAQDIVDREQEILVFNNPFRSARLLFLTGGPGRGKTHLLEATMNHILNEAPNLKGKMYLDRSNFTTSNIGMLQSYDNAPILFIDDLYADRKTSAELHPNTDIKVLMNFIMDMYERRRLVIASCNFSLKSELLKMIREVDTVGRTVSRLREILPISGELKLLGPDYRSKIAALRKSQRRHDSGPDSPSSPSEKSSFFFRYNINY